MSSLRLYNQTMTFPSFHSSSDQMKLLMTYHGTFLAIRDGNLTHVAYQDPTAEVVYFTEQQLIHDTTINGLGADSYRVKRSGHTVSFMTEKHYVSVLNFDGRVEYDRTSVAQWESFTPVNADARWLVADGLDGDAEAKRFSERVIELNASDQPVKVYCGCGAVPRAGFLNLDIAVYAPTFFATNPDDYFIFPFSCVRWPIEDCSVDYIFHEDFIEHISQLEQWQFLAETRRVLKSGEWHRVNTPNMMTSMKDNSSFENGCDGVYTGEKGFGHDSMFTPSLLKEMAEAVGYRDVIYTTRNSGVSRFAVEDLRPLPDRDDIVGNIFADLRK